MSRSLSRAVLLLGAITLPISGRLCAQVAKVALGLSLCCSVCVFTTMR